MTAWASSSAAHKASATATAQLRHRMLARAVALGPSWLAGERSAELAEVATRGIDDLDGYFTSYLPALILAAVVPVAALPACAGTLAAACSIGLLALSGWLICRAAQRPLVLALMAPAAIVQACGLGRAALR